MPSWVGDAAMSVPALRALRLALSQAHVTALCRPGIDAVLEGCPFVDEFVVGRPKGVKGVLRLAGRLRRGDYDATLLLPGSFKTALLVRLAGIGERIGYRRDGRGLLLSRGCDPPRRDDGAFATVPAVRYYLDLVRFAFPGALAEVVDIDERLELWTTPRDEAEAERIFAEAAVGADRRVVVLNPGANRADKRWPAVHFAAVGDHLAREYDASIFITGAPAEREIIESVRAAMHEPSHDLQALGVDLRSLKAVLRHSDLLITNDTGPRHLGVALGTAVIALFGPTDPRWTTLTAARQVELLADPTLEPHERADDQPARCRINKIAVEDVVAAARSLLAQQAGSEG